MQQEPTGEEQQDERDKPAGNQLAATERKLWHVANSDNETVTRV